VLLLCLLLALAPPEEGPLPDPLSLDQAVAIARQRRPELAAASARARAAAARPAVVGALEDPMLMVGVDHLPFGLHGVDASAMIEQRFPLSRERANRRRVAEAQARLSLSKRNLVGLDVALDAASAFLMLQERRRMGKILTEQAGLADSLVVAARARYGSGTGAAAELLRAETEVARLRAEMAASSGEIRSSEAMLNASLGRGATQPVPDLVPLPEPPEPGSALEVLRAARMARPELNVGRAEVEGAQAELALMRSMDAPMAIVRLGVARTMAEGPGVMGLIGVSLPLYRDKRQAAVREAEAMVEMAGADVAAMNRMIEGEVLAARERVIATRTRHRALREEVVPRARKAVDAALAGYRAGQGTLVPAIETLSAFWQVQAEEVMAESTAALAAARLRRATGAGEDGRR
jgi:cobalt-zinc-cadmium efflux system outer membrane protein